MEEEVINSEAVLCKEEKALKHKSKGTQAQWVRKIKTTQSSKKTDKKSKT